MKKNKVSIEITEYEDVIIKDGKGNRIEMSIIDLCGIAREYDAFCYREDLKDLIEKAVVRGDVPMELVGNKRFLSLLLGEFMDAKEEEDCHNAEKCFQAALANCLPFEAGKSECFSLAAVFVAKEGE